MAKTSDVLIKWKIDGSENVVNWGDIDALGENTPIIGAPIRMWWAPQKKWWEGTILAHDMPSQTLAEDDDVPLSKLIANNEKGKNLQSPPPAKRCPSTDKGQAELPTNGCTPIDESILRSSPPANGHTSTDEILLRLPPAGDGCAFADGSVFQSSPPAKRCTLIDESVPPSGNRCASTGGSVLQLSPPTDGSTSTGEIINESPDIVETGLQTIFQQTCETIDCGEEVFSACTRCLALLCYDHSVMDLPCNSHITADVVTVLSGDTTLPLRDISNVGNAAESADPESFVVDGPAPEEGNAHLPLSKSRKRVAAREDRNHGRPYQNPRTGKWRPARKVLGSRCKQGGCQRRGFCCEEFSDSQRQEILDSFYDLGNLARQRQWIKQHVVASSITGRRKKLAYSYSLPTDSALKPVCRLMFLSTVGIAERQVRTTMAKTNENGHLEPEKRGGRPEAMAQRDRKLRDDIERHINRFSRMESHYCRKKTSYHYLSPELNIPTMYRLYTEECVREGRDKGSQGLYRSVFRRQKLKFHVPKKDMCGLCDTYNRGNDGEREAIKHKYEQHIREKEAVRRLKEDLKSKAKVDRQRLVASFDLQQVLYVPKSMRGEIFYKRKLACYNFTICDIASMDGVCFFWHEGIARRGANEIASHLHKFLCHCDDKRITEIELFADGCSGQNKNSIVPVMMACFLEESTNVSKITLNFFETSHGQNEGDAIHSVIERAVKRSTEVIIPSQLATVVRMASHRPYQVHEVTTDDISDWKQLAQDRGVLRVRTSEEGDAIDWTTFMTIKLEKEKPGRIFFKTSHLHDNFSTINLERNRRNSNSETTQRPGAIEIPKISEAKYKDLMSLCSGDIPVVFHQDHKAFYGGLPHQ